MQRKMFKWGAFPFIRISLSLIAGVIVFNSSPWFWNYWEAVLPIFATLAFVISLISENPLIKGIAMLSTIFYLGGALCVVSNDLDAGNHYTRYHRVNGFIGMISSDNTERAKYQRYEVKLKALKSGAVLKPVSGKILLYVKKDSSDEKNYRYGDVVSVGKRFFDVDGPKNPHEFNYRQYLINQDIYAHAFVKANDVELICPNQGNPVLKLAYAIRSAIKKQVSDHIDSPRERAIVYALLLGIKDYLDDETKLAYSSAGAMHVLAVSGLHVGIIFVMLSYIFRKWKAHPIGKFVFASLSIIVIWIYALITGFSPSVTRAVTMFTVIVISSAINRKANIYNSLGMAAFVLVAINPNIIYSVGFQLSFTAVIGIVAVHPRLYRLWKPGFLIMDYAWNVTCVSISAQIATFPLALLYFHQFPTYFLISNLVVIPAATVILATGIFMGILGFVHHGPASIVGQSLEWAVYVVNECIWALQDLPCPVVDRLYFDVPETILVYLIMLFALLGFAQPHFPSLAFGCCLLIMVFGRHHFKSVNQIRQQKIVFYEIDGVTAIDLIRGTDAKLLIDQHDEEQWKSISSKVDPNRLANGLDKAEGTNELFENSPLVYHHDQFDLIEWNGMKIVCLRKVGSHLENSINADVIYFKRPDHVNLAIEASTVILGNGFNRYKARQAEAQLKALGLEVHILSRDGYWSKSTNRY